jgi:hypothetical protein
MLSQWLDPSQRRRREARPNTMAIVDDEPDPPQPVVFEPDDYASATLPAGSLLWHYTRDFHGLKGIVGGDLWASSLRYLNDTEEFQYGARLAFDTLRSLLVENEYTRALMLRVIKSLLINFTPDDAFSVSFSTEEDDLSQWRAYSSGGPSFSVGFDPHSLELHAAGYGFQLHKVIYDKDLIAADVTKELQHEAQEINDLLGADVDQTPEDFATRHGGQLIGRVLLLAPRYKHPKFEAENEWRLIRWMPVLFQPPRLWRRYRLSGSLVVPYIAMPLHSLPRQRLVYEDGNNVQSPMRAVTVGPSPHMDHLKYAVEDMVSRNGLALIDVRQSSIPFRNW